MEALLTGLLSDASPLIEKWIAPGEFSCGSGRREPYRYQSESHRPRTDCLPDVAGETDFWPDHEVSCHTCEARTYQYY